jgi:hypothetical protein
MSEEHHAWHFPCGESALRAALCLTWVLLMGGAEPAWAQRVANGPDGPHGPVEQHPPVRAAVAEDGEPPRAEDWPAYAEHQDLSYFLDSSGQKRPMRAPRDWRIRRRHIVAGLERVMGELPGDDRRCSLDARVVEEVRVGDVVRRKVTYRTEPDDVVSAWLFLPPANGNPLPAVLCLHQTTTHGKDEPAGVAGDPELQYALELAQRGFVTLAPDFPSFGEHEYDFDARHGYASGTMKGIWDNIRSIDMLVALPEVDSERIGCIGHSLGGHMTMFTAVFDSRIKVLVSSCGFSAMHKDDVPSWTGPRYMPRIASDFDNDADRLPFDFCEVVASFAPRPFLACAATRDDDFDVSGVRDVMDAARPIYELHEAGDRLQAIYPEAGHSFPAETRVAAYEFLETWLRSE